VLNVYLDTNAIIYHLKSGAAAASVLEPMFARDVALDVSAITELELLSSPAPTDDEISAISQLLTFVVIIPVDSRLARLAGDLRRVYRVKTADSVIAATALLTHTLLVTRNIEDFQRITPLSLMPI
jgi:predicted nucleic acid-binding protein